MIFQALYDCLFDWRIKTVFKKERVTSLCDAVKTCYEATNGEGCPEFVSDSLLLINALLALGKVPGHMTESVSRKETCFSRVSGSMSPAEKLLSQSCWTREGRGRSKVMQGDISR